MVAAALLTFVPSEETLLVCQAKLSPLLLGNLTWAQGQGRIAAVQGFHAEELGKYSEEYCLPPWGSPPSHMTASLWLSGNSFLRTKVWS